MKSTFLSSLLVVVAAFLPGCATPAITSIPNPAPTAVSGAPNAAAATLTSSPARPQVLRIDLANKPDIPDLPRFLAVETLREMGYTVETFQFDDNTLSIQALEQGDLDVANASNGIAWSAIQKGARLASIVDDINDSRVLLATSEIQKCADLDGKQVAMSSTTSTQAYMVDQYIAKNCPGTKIEPVVISGSSNRLAALSAGQLAATPVDLANYLALLRQGNKNLHVLSFFAKEFPGLRGTSQIVRRDFIEKYPETTQDMIRAILMARRKLADPEVLSEQIVKYVELEPQDAQAAAKAFLENKVWDLNGGLTPELLQFNIDFFETAGALEPGLGANDVAELAPLNAVLDEIGRK